MLVLWERRVTLASGIREPVLPWRFMKERAMLGILLYAPIPEGLQRWINPKANTP